jgi:23S rRNA pseudouridine2605 synthase
LPSDDSKRPFKSGFKKTDDKPGSNFSSEKRSPKSFGRSGGAEERPSGERSYNRKPLGDKPFGDRPQSDKPQGGKPYGNRPSGEKRPFGDRPQGDKLQGDRPQSSKPQSGKPYGNRPSGEKRPFGDRPQGDKPQGDRPQGDRPFASRENKYSDKNAPAKRFNDKPFKSRVKEEYSSSDRPKLRSDDQKWSSEERFVNKRSKKPAPPKEDDGLIRLNRFIANAGICSRRKADELIAAGVVSVNGEPVTELGFKVDPAKDSVRYNGESLKRERNVYVLLNKPKDYITTTDDPQERKTVMSLVEKASRERIYPVGRLDRNTTGLLLMTNDGDLAEKLSHPRNNITKLYQVELNKSLSQGDMNKITFGIELEDGLIKPDQVSYVAGGSKKEVGIQIHSGKNRVVRRIFESLGYEVVKLDRVVYSHLTKKDLPRGRWRYLEEKEIIQLKHLIK